MKFAQRTSDAIAIDGKMIAVGSGRAVLLLDAANGRELRRVGLTSSLLFQR